MYIFCTYSDSPLLLVCTNPSKLKYEKSICKDISSKIQPALCLILRQAAARHESLTSQNLAKKARWREEAEREKEAALALSDKAQWGNNPGVHSKALMALNSEPVMCHSLL